MKRTCHIVFLVGLSALLAGCMGYRLGGARPEGAGTVFVAAVVNRTQEPAIEVQVTDALRRRFQFDGRTRLASSAEAADAVVEVSLNAYTLTPVAYRSDLGTTPQQYRLRISAQATLKEAATGRILSESSTYGEALFRFESDLASSKRNALPRAAEELAKFLADDLFERW